MSIKQEADAHSNSMADNMSSAASASGQQGMMDPIDSLLDLSEYDNANQFNSPALSTATSKNSFARTTAASTPSSMLSTSQQMTGPSHQYDQYKQQTGFVPGALANTFAVTQNSNPQMVGYNNGFDMNFINMNSADDMFDFNTAPNGASVSPSDIDLEFESPTADPSFFFAEQQIPSAPASVIVQTQEMQSPPVVAANGGGSQAGSVGRLWPGMHQQAAMAKAQAQQRQQQQVIQQQQQRQRQSVSSQGQMKPEQQPMPQPQSQRAKAGQPSDPIVEQKITQLLSSMRAKPSSPNGSMGGMGNISRLKKDEEDMDEDERLLASEEGKKLSSKERRQLRNKVSARAFRSRRKEYISQLEAEIAGKVTENGDLRAQNRLLAEENKRLSDLTRMLLGSPSFSDFLDRLSANPALVPQNQAQAQSQAVQAQVSSQVSTQVASQDQERQPPKDANPYAAQQQIGMAMIPEQNIDFSMLHMDAEPAFAFQPQVYAVLETPDVTIPSIDTSVLTGKLSNFVGCEDEEEKVEMPIIAHPVTDKVAELVPSVAPAAADAAFDNDPAFALYHDAAVSTASTAFGPADAPAAASKPLSLNTEVMSDVDSIFGGVETEKALSRYELVGAASEEEEEAEIMTEAEESLALARIARIARSIQTTASRLDRLNAE
ncbi:bzip transcription factor [Sporothrix brasiliensis 5110]|uniref:Bzip transcription factor n=1 Tax=Sporothrix brasiliensis 5110 TaxID=1398154 RepID=A0A0C2IVF9_9PEZI|nr:bzip transcription factor [Sporothrix brasiliensis 5110]KIH90760.1 bzip transcription factor [Sporothrix brasiliensis 5110]